MRDTLIIAAIIAFYLLLLLAHPVHRCPRCRGRKSVTYGPVRRPCRHCRCTGRTYRPGAVFLHRQLREHLWPSLRARITDRVLARTADVTGEEP